MENEYGVTFCGDYFSLTINVQGVEVNEGDDPHEVAIDLAANVLGIHYGWDVKAVSTEIDVYCESDNPTHHQGDTCPIRESSVNREDELIRLEQKAQRLAQKQAQTKTILVETARRMERIEKQQEALRSLFRQALRQN